MKKSLSKITWLACMFMLFGTVWAQAQIDVSGTVADAAGITMPGVNITIKGTLTGTVTNMDGKYSINVPNENTILVFSFVGYATQEIAVGNRQSINVSLEEDAIMLGEVITIGYATGSKRTISGAVQKVGREEMNVGLVNNPLQSIKGKVAGVNITKSGGDPTAGSTIRIRGTTSLSGGNDPLVIIDGVFGDVNLLNSLSPGDIESYTILKDASETAQYGSRGASGVIVVTTAKGVPGGKNVVYEGTFGLETVYKNLEMLNGDQYRQLAADGGYINALDMGYNTNFIEEMQRLGFTQNHRISFGGGTSDYSSYRASVGIIDQQGIIKNNKMQNYTAKLDITQMMFDQRLKLEMGLFGSKREQYYVNDHQKTFYSAASYNPTFPTFKNDDGTWPEDPNANEVQNPLGRLEIKDEESYLSANAHARLTWSFSDALKLSLFGSYTYGVKENKVYIPSNIKAGLSDKGKADRIDNKNNDVMGNITLNYKKAFGKHRLDLLGLAEAQKYDYTGFRVSVRGFGTNFFGFDNLAAGANVKYNKDEINSYANGYSLVSFMGRFNYVYDERYIATVNLRGDGSSKLGANNKWGFFPSGSLAWAINNEAFLKDSEIISNLKLRVGYGLTGNQDAIAAYNSLSLMGPTGITTVNGVPTVTYGYNRNSNPDLRWEVKAMFDIGVDVGFFDDRLTATVDYYTSRTKDLLYEYYVPVPPFVYDRLLANLGEMRNDGVELSIGYAAIQTKDIGLHISANLAYQKNELMSLNGTYMGQDLTAQEYLNIVGMNGAGFIGGYNQMVYQIVGQPLGVFYLPKCNGLIDNGFGEYTYNILDIDGEEGISLANGKDRYIAGQSMPKYYLSGNINFRYKAFDVQAQFNGAFGHHIYNGTSLTYMNMSQFPTYNVMKDAPAKNIKDQTVTDYWLEKGDYMHFDYLSIGYTFDVSKIGWLSQLRVSASVNNLYTFTNYSGLSPLINSATIKKDNNDIGVDDKRFYPLSRTYSIGVSVNF